MDLIRGINIGGYLSQCHHSEEHYDTFFEEKNVRQIKAWGFDHIRLPFDYEVLEDEDGQTRTEGYSRLQRVCEWCRNYDLRLILDLHKAHGYDFNDAGDTARNSLFTDEENCKRFVSLWERIAMAFGSYEHVAFELLNEVVEEENADGWNELIRQTVTVIRAITKNTTIIYGGIRWNSADALALLDPPVSDNIMYTFHFYEPLIFTHQKAHWVENIVMDRDIPYPDTMENYRSASGPMGVKGAPLCQAKSTQMGPNFIREMTKDAVDVARSSGIKLYCGEFGVIDQAPLPDTVRWFADVIAVLRENNIGYAVWTYKQKDFGISDSHYELIREELLDILTDTTIEREDIV